ncbi:MAG: DUF177 domain-containing protein [Paracoccus sp. (in: a-proteobacteria)]|nr:DUF177 domain-containing protein [Paracoccus sp. (in: a-proteobacteria)]
MAAERSPIPDRLRVAHLSATRDNEFALAPDHDVRGVIADQLGLLELPELTMSGAVRASGADEWVLTAGLRARVVQPCVVTLEPVETAITESVTLTFSPHVTAPDEEEAEMGDDTVEPLGQWIALGEIALEALVLALPTHPRAPGAEMPEAALAPDDGADSGETRRPFAGLADLMKRDRDG